MWPKHCGSLHAMNQVRTRLLSNTDAARHDIVDVAMVAGHHKTLHQMRWGEMS